MTPREAEKIVNLYGGAFTNETNIARKKSLLPCSVAKIKQAYFIYIEELIKHNLLTKGVGTTLALTYSMLDAFVDDAEAEKIHEVNKKIISGELDCKIPENKTIRSEEHTS